MGEETWRSLWRRKRLPDSPFKIALGKSLYTEIVNEACFESLDNENRTFGTTESEVVLVSTDASKRNSSQPSRVCRQREGRQQIER